MFGFRLNCVSAAVALSLFTFSAQAQVTKSDDQESKGLGFDEVVITGTGAKLKKFDASYSISSLSASDIQKIAPLNITDLLGQMPGVFAEATGGEVQNIYRVRGIPNEGNFYSFQEDGMLIYGENEAFFAKGDVLVRMDMMTEGFEVVRGGPAPIFADNAAAIFNLKTRQGGENPAGGLQLTMGDTGLNRYDGFVSGKLSDRTYFALGGFYRKHDGYRDNGFPSDDGGQFRVNIRHKLDDGEFRVFGKVLQDKNVFLLPIPLADPRNPSVSLNPYIDYFTGTLNSPALQTAKFIYPDVGGVKTSQNRDLSNGRNLNYKNTGFDIDLNNVGGWKMNEKFRYTEGKLDFDALYSTFNPADANTFAAGYLNAAKTAFGSGVSRLGYTYAASGLAYDPSKASGLVVQAGYRAIQNDFDSMSNDIRFTRDFNLAGTHRVTAGLLVSRYNAEMNMRYQDYLLEVKGKPQPLDLVAYDSTGKALGRVTDAGVLRYASTLLGGKSTMNVSALYVADNWKVNKELTLDAGLRHTTYKGDGYTKATARYNLGDSTTLADDSTLGYTGVNTPRTLDGSDTSWTVGGNYDLTPNWGIYTRTSTSFRLPSESNIFIASPPVTTKAEQFELGTKFATKEFSIFATAYLSRFRPFSTSVAEVNPATGLITTQTFVGNVESPGVEFDFSWKPSRMFSLDGSVTMENPKSGNLLSAAGVQSITAEGKQPIRQPKEYGNIRPTVYFKLNDWTSSAYARYNFVGKRFVDLQNLTALPAYNTLSLGFTATNGDYMIQVVGDNVTNAKGITEGNTRTDAVAGQGTPEAIYGRPLFGRNFRVVLSKYW